MIKLAQGRTTRKSQRPHSRPPNSAWSTLSPAPSKGTPTPCPSSAFPRALAQPTELLGAGVVAPQNVTSATDLLCAPVKSAIRSQKCSLPTVLELAGVLRGLQRDPRGLQRDPRGWAGLWGRELESGVGADQSPRGCWPRGPIAGNQDSARPGGGGDWGTNTPEARSRGRRRR